MSNELLQCTKNQKWTKSVKISWLNWNDCKRLSVTFMHSSIETYGSGLMKIITRKFQISYIVLSSFLRIRKKRGKKKEWRWLTFSLSLSDSFSFTLFLSTYTMQPSISFNSVISALSLGCRESWRSEIPWSRAKGHTSSSLLLYFCRNLFSKRKNFQCACTNIHTHYLTWYCLRKFFKTIQPGFSSRGRFNNWFRSVKRFSSRGDMNRFVY